LVNNNVVFVIKWYSTLMGATLVVTFSLDPLNPVIPHIHSNNEPSLETAPSFQQTSLPSRGTKTKEVSCKIMPIVPFPCTISCPGGGGGAPSPEDVPNRRHGLQQNIISLSGDKLTGPDLDDLGSSLSQSIRPQRERVASSSLVDYQAANLRSNSSKSFGLISSELLPLTVQSTPSLS
jgi:hypothetical protein